MPGQSCELRVGTAPDPGHREREGRHRIICGNAADLYNNGVLPPVADEPGDHQSLDTWREHMGDATALADALRKT